VLSVAVLAMLNPPRHAFPHYMVKGGLVVCGEQQKKVTSFLKTILGRPVVVKLNSGVDYRGEPPF
jgi:hypothetical protein